MRKITIRTTDEFMTLVEKANDTCDVKLENLDLRKIGFYKVDIAGLRFENCRFSKQALEHCNLSNTSFTKCDLRGVKFRHQNMRGSRFLDCDLGGASFGACDLEDAVFDGSNLRRASFALVANLRNVVFNNCQVRGVWWPSPTMVLLAYWDCIPDHLVLELMRYDAANHPHPKKFVLWANGGKCPYSEERFRRAANFQEDSDLYIPGPALPSHVLVKMLLDWTCKP